MMALAKRHILIFFRDKTAIFFSLLSVFIIIGLYALFLGNVFESGMSEIPGSRFLMDSWIMSGILAVTSVTTVLGAYGVMVEDRVNKTIKDFSASPLPRWKLAVSYAMAAVFIGVVMSLLAFVFAEGYIVAYGGSVLPLALWGKLLGVMVLSVVSSGAMVLFMTSFLYSSNAFATFSTILGTLIGFVAGIYLPIGQLPGGVQWVVRLFPVSHSAVLFRQVMMDAPMAASFLGAAQQDIEGFETTMGVAFLFGGHRLSFAGSVWVLVATALVFFGLSVLVFLRKKR